MRAEEIRGLMEAYSKIHETPEVLNEQTEDLHEIGVNFGGQAAVNRVRAQAAQERKSAARIDALRQQRFGSGGSPSASKPTTSSTAKPQPQMKGLSIGQGGFRVNNKPVNPGMSPIFKRPGQETPTPSAKPAAAPAPKPAEAPKKTFNPLMQKTFGYQTGYAPDQVKGNIKKMAQMASLKNISAGVDIFDLVKGHLLDEGYADSEEGAMVIMVNMSEEWKNSILESYGIELDEAS